MKSLETLGNFQQLAGLGAPGLKHPAIGRAPAGGCVRDRRPLGHVVVGAPGDEEGPWLMPQGGGRDYPVLRKRALLAEFRTLASLVGEAWKTGSWPRAKHARRPGGPLPPPGPGAQGRWTEAEEAIRVFASEYGPLREPGTYWVTARLSVRPEVESWAEPVPLWVNELRQAQPLFDLWGLIVARRSPDILTSSRADGRLQEWFTSGFKERPSRAGTAGARGGTVVRRFTRDQERHPWAWSSGVGWFRLPESYGLLEFPEFEIDRGLTRRFRPGDLASLANYFLSVLVDWHLERQVDVRVLPLQRNALWYFPRDLLAAIYMQFAFELGGAADGRPRWCRKPGCINPVIGTGQRRYCSPEHARDAQSARWYDEHKAEKLAAMAAARENRRKEREQAR